MEPSLQVSHLFYLRSTILGSDSLALTLFTRIILLLFYSYYSRGFGLLHVEYVDNTKFLNRTLKDSSKFFIEVHETGRIPEVLPTSGASTLRAALLLLLANLGRWLIQ